jgi:2-succinyl-5-enolpyruvyl-6-hydroxy-3-cyclohexene-1-carboxylate synthase
VTPEDWVICLANSLPVREADAFAPVRQKGHLIAVNRGASGIDGTIASACGFAKGAGRPAVLITGDLSFLHDISSLTLLRDSKTPLIIVVLNNDGGGIFSFLPTVPSLPEFDRFFGTPHGLTFEKAAELYRIPYMAPHTLSLFESCLEAALKEGAGAILEVQTARESTAKTHAAIVAAIGSALQ